MADKPKVTLHLIEDRRSLGQLMLTRMRGKLAGEPRGVPDDASQWWFMLGWVMRGCAAGLPDDDEMVEQAFIDFTLATGESKVLPE
jgi:hypothetical protein